MAYRVVVEERAAREIRKLPPPARRQVIAKAESLAQNPRPPGVEKLAGEEALYRVRTGDYRVVYRIHDDVLLVLVVSAAHRGDVYRKLRRRRGK